MSEMVKYIEENGELKKHMETIREICKTIVVNINN